jgi:hypothetical protein
MVPPGFGRTTLAKNQSSGIEIMGKCIKNPMLKRAVMTSSISLFLNPFLPVNLFKAEIRCFDELTATR